MWLASTSTSAASRSALCASLKPRCASTMARKASSGFAKFELVDNAMRKPQLKTSVHAGGARQRRIQRRPRRVAKACRDIAVGPQQIARSGLRIVARGGEARRIDKAAIAADADRCHVPGRLDGRAVAKLQQREPHSRTDEGVGQKRLTARPFRNRRVEYGSPRPRSTAPGIAIV